ncbi:MAG: SGNH/GDSL hydrolase family protein, partial [Planctomycetota bacterium]
MLKRASITLRIVSILSFAILASHLASASTLAADAFELKKSDHIAYIGNTLPDRMQHHGWLETYIQSLFPEHDLTFRNLGFSGDEVKTRTRSDNFGSADEWLTKVKADVIFAFFGYSESLRGAEGLAGFRSDLAEMIDGLLAQKYNGESAPRLVVFSPLAHEDLESPHLPDGSDNNARLAVYTQAMKEVCAEKKIRF